VGLREGSGGWFIYLGHLDGWRDVGLDNSRQLLF
jgi:hypothetical protein